MLKNKNAVIVGGSRGMGEAIAKLFAKNNANVCIISRNQEDLEKVVKDIKTQGGSAEYIIGDITKYEQMEKAFEQYRSSKRKIDILVNNAGIYRENSDTHPDNKINPEVVSC